MNNQKRKTARRKERQRAAFESFVKATKGNTAAINMMHFESAPQIVKQRIVEAHKLRG